MDSGFRILVSVPDSGFRFRDPDSGFLVLGLPTVKTREGDKACNLAAVTHDLPPPLQTGINAVDLSDSDLFSQTFQLSISSRTKVPKQGETS